MPEVRDTAVKRQLIHLEVACVKDISTLCADEDGQRIRNGMVDCNELALEGAELLHLPLRHCQRVRLDPVFLKLGFHQGKGQLGSDQGGNVSFKAQEVGHSANVVLVAVGQHDANDVLQAVLNVGEIRQDQVNAGLGLLGGRARHSQPPAVCRRFRRPPCCGQSLPVHRAGQSAACLSAVSAE